MKYLFYDDLIIASPLKTDELIYISGMGFSEKIKPIFLAYNYHIRQKTHEVY